MQNKQSYYHWPMNARLDNAFRCPRNVLEFDLSFYSVFSFLLEKLEGVGYSSHVFSFEDTIFWSLHCAVQTHFRSIIPLTQGKKCLGHKFISFWLNVGRILKQNKDIHLFCMNLFLFSRDQNVMGIKSKHSFWNLLLSKVLGLRYVLVFLPWMRFVSSPRSW